MRKQLIPVLRAVQETRVRREKDWEKIDTWHQSQYNIRGLYAQDWIIMWINKYTTGRFYLSGTWIAFEDEMDFVIFKLMV